MATSTLTPVQSDDVRPGPHPAAVGGVAAVLTVIVAYALGRWFATGCGNPDAKFSCLVEGLVLAVAAPVVVPLLAWPVLRAVGVRRALLTALLGPILGVALGYPIHQVVAGASTLAGHAPVVSSTPESAVTAIAAALALGSGAAVATLLLSGRVGPRAWAIAGAVLVLALGATSLVENVQEDQALRTDLAGADVPLVAPPPGWVIQSAYVSDAGDLRINAHPDGEVAYGEGSVDVAVTSLEPDSACAYDTCRTTPDGLVLVTSETSTDVVTRVGGAFVEVVSYRDGPDAENRVLEVARGLRVLDVDALADLVGS